MTHHGVRIVLLLDGRPLVDMNSLVAHHAAALEGGVFRVLIGPGSNSVELLLDACEIDDTPPDDE